MKQSRYNVFLKLNGKDYVVNTLSKGMVCIDERHLSALHPSMEGNLSSIEDSLPALSELGIVVDDKLNEVGSLRYAYNQSKASTGELEFVVAPTMNCNFRCTYCFETARKGRMTDETQDAVYSFIEDKIRSLSPTRLRFIWFGGEPLLAMDIVESFSRRLLQLTKDAGIKLNMIVITNGYLIDSDVVSRLEACGVTAVQITIDGNRDTHDKRRVLVNGSGTYDRIVANLEAFKNSSMEVGVRVNIDRDNVGAFRDVKNAIASIGNENISCRPALVEPASKHDETIRSRCYMSDCSEFYQDEGIQEYYSTWRLDDLGVQLCYCGAEHNNSYAIDECGNLYKCWNSMGIDSEVLGSVFKPYELNEVIVSQFLGRDPFTEDECSECAYMPICGGGCFEQLRVTGHHSCSFQRHIFEQVANGELDC